MDFKCILEKGYNKLVPYLSDRCKGIIDGYEYAISDLCDFKNNIEDYVGNSLSDTATAIELEIAKDIVDFIIDYLKDCRDENTVSMIDNNDKYEIGYDGEVHEVTGEYIETDGEVAGRGEDSD